METSLAKRRRLEAGAQQRLEQNIAYWRARGVPLGLMPRVLPIVRILRQVLGGQDEAIQLILDQLRLPMRALWGYLRPYSRPTTSVTNVWVGTAKYIDLWPPCSQRVLISRALFATNSLVVITAQWLAPPAWHDDRQSPPSNPFFPPDRV